MRTARANRLARRAFRLRGNGSRGPWARRALRTLSTAAERYDQNAVVAMREAWLRNPRDDTWQEVGRWCPLAEVLAAAVDPRRPAESRAALGAFCLRHHEVPDNDVAHALFFVLTGHHERYEALDPDGTLLASGYRGASDATREALRHTMLGLGEVNLVRVIADRPDRPLTEAEGDYLAGQLAGAGDWDGLWRLVPTVPLASAVRAAKLFGDWRPPDDLGQAFLARLAVADPKVVSAVAAVSVTRIKVRTSWELSFAPDGSELAIRHDKGTTIHDPHTGRQLVSYPDREQLGVLALGNGTIVHKGGRHNNWSVARRTPERPYEVLVSDKPSVQIGGTPGGFVVSYDGILLFGAASGSWSRRESVGESHLGAGGMAFGMMAADPVSGHLVLCTGGVDMPPDVVLFDAGLTVLARGPREGHEHGAFCGPERLLRWRWGAGQGIVSWRRNGARLMSTAWGGLDDSFMHPTPLSGSNLVVVRRRQGRLAWLDTETLTEVDGPAGFGVTDARHVAFSQDGSLAAVAPRTDGVEVHDLGLCRLTALVDRPLARLTLADLETVETQAKRALTPPVTEAVELLRAGLAYRFGADVALGAWVAGGVDDIALGGA